MGFLKIFIKELWHNQLNTVIGVGGAILVLLGICIWLLNFISIKNFISHKNFLNEKIKGKKVSIRRVTEDKYGRTVGELSFNGENIQELLVKEGHAEIYKKYSKPCKWAS